MTIHKVGEMILCHLYVMCEEDINFKFNSEKIKQNK